MKAFEKSTVFGAYWPFYRVLTVYKTENFRNLHVRIILQNVCLAVGFAVLQFGYYGFVTIGTWHCYKHIDHLAENASLLGMMISSTQIAVMFASISRRMQRVNSVLRNLQAVVCKRCNQSPASLTIYVKLEQRFEYFAGMAIRYSIFMSVAFNITTGLMPISYLIFRYPDPDHWIRILQVSHRLIESILTFCLTCPMQSVPLPSDTNVFVAFYADWMGQSSACMLYYAMACTPAIFFVGMCLYISGLKKDLQTMLSKSDGTTPGQLIGTVLFHNEIIDIADGVHEIMNVGLFVQLLVCAVSLAVCMVGMEKSTPLSMNFFLAFAALLTAVLSTYIYCFLSENATSEMSAIGDMFYEYSWYLTPVKQQYIFGMAIHRAQITFRMTGLGFIDCSLVVFTAIMRAAGSYFIMMRRLK